MFSKQCILSSRHIRKISIHNQHITKLCKWSHGNLRESKVLRLAGGRTQGRLHCWGHGAYKLLWLKTLSPNRCLSPGWNQTDRKQIFSAKPRLVKPGKRKANVGSSRGRRSEMSCQAARANCRGLLLCSVFETFRACLLHRPPVLY